MNLYYVRYDNEDGLDLSSLVRAQSVEEATKFWQQKWVEYFPEGQDPPAPIYVGLVPLNTGPGVIDWSIIQKGAWA